MSLRPLPLLCAAVLSVATVIVLLPAWVAAAFVAGAASLVLHARARTDAAIARAASIASFALGCSVGPVVYLLLAAIVAVVP